MRKMPSFGLLATLPAVAGHGVAFPDDPVLRSSVNYNRLPAGCYRTVNFIFKELYEGVTPFLFLAVIGVTAFKSVRPGVSLL
jgi:hypothetical protein